MTERQNKEKLKNGHCHQKHTDKQKINFSFH